MYQLKDFEFKASDISAILNCELLGADIMINNIQKFNDVQENSMIICYPDQKELLHQISTHCLVFCTKSTIVEKPNLSYIIYDYPDVLFFKFLNEYLVKESDYWHNNIISEKSEQYPNVQFGYNVKVGKNVVIAPDSVIGSNTIIGCNVVIRSNVTIGEKCCIKDNSVIGSEGFGFISSHEGLTHIPQIGSIKIGNEVIIGSNCTIEKPTMGSTIIHDNVKIDDLVQIGQNQIIGENTVIATGFKAEAGVKIGSNSFIGMGVTIISGKIIIGNNCIVGAGTLVTKSIADNKIIYGKTQEVIKDSDNTIDYILASYRNIK